MRWLLLKCRRAVARYMRSGRVYSTETFAKAVKCIPNDAMPGGVAPGWHLHMGCGEPLRSQWLLKTVPVVRVAATSTTAPGIDRSRIPLV